MALPELTNGAKTATKNRVSKLGQSISGSISPKRLAQQGFDTVKNAVSNEVPELAGIASSLKGGISDFVADFNQNMKEEMGESNEKLTQIKDNTDKTNDGLDTVAQLIATDEMNAQLIRIQEQNDEEIAEIRTLTDISRHTAGLAEAQLDALRDANKLSIQENKESKFKQQKDDSQGLLPTKEFPMPKEAKKKGKGNSGLSTLATFGLFRILGDLVTPLKKLVVGIAGFAGIAGMLPKSFKAIEENGKNLTRWQKLRAKAEAKRDKNEKFLKRKNLRDEKTKRFRKVNQTDRNLLNQKQGRRRKAVTSKFRAVGGLAKGIGGAIASLGGIAFFVTAIFGALSGGLKAYLQGDDVKTIIAKSVKSFVVTPFQLLSDLVSKMLGVNSPDIAKIYDGISTGIGHAFKFLTYDMWRGEFWSDLFKGMVDKMTQGVMSLTEKMGDWMKSAGDSIAKTFESFFNGVMNGVKSMANNVIDKIPLLPDGAKNRLKLDVTTEPEMPAVAPSPKAQNQAGEILQAQNSINDETIARSLAPIGENNASGSVLNAPITQNVTNTSIISPNLITRNPDSPLFLNNKVTF